jgi:hypothetical protein
MKSKILSAVVISGILLFGIQATALADEGAGDHVKHEVSEPQGFEGTQIIVVGGAVVIASGLAFTIGRRTRKKK